MKVYQHLLSINPDVTLDEEKKKFVNQTYQQQKFWSKVLNQFLISNKLTKNGSWPKASFTYIFKIESQENFFF